jgi:hypothetical protein
MEVCLNCKTEYEGNYCPNCGQPKDPGRLELRYFGTRFIKDILDFNRGWLPTIVGLTTRFREMVQGYLSGRRVGIISPLKYAFFINALYLLLESFKDTKVPDSVNGAKDAYEGAFSFEVGFVFGKLMTRYGSWIILPMIACLAVSSRMIFSDRRWNMAEHLALQSYVLGHSILFSTCYLLLPNFSFGVLGNSLFPLFLMVFNGWAFFQAKKGWEAVLLAIAVAIVAYFIYLVVSFSLVSAYVALFM